METDEDSRYDWRKYDEMALAHYKKLLKQDYNYDYDKGDYMTESKNPLKDAQKFAKKHRKGQGYFVKYNAGDVEKGIEMFNKATSIGTIPTSGGEGGQAMGEDIETRQINIDKELDRMDIEDENDYRDLHNMYDCYKYDMSEDEKKNLILAISNNDKDKVEKILLNVQKRVDRPDIDFFDMGTFYKKDDLLD